MYRKDILSCNGSMTLALNKSLVALYSLILIIVYCFALRPLKRGGQEEIVSFIIYFATPFSPPSEGRWRLPTPTYNPFPKDS